jgi:hypothetical protein
MCADGCARCPYTPQDLTGHYDPEAALHMCAKYDGEQGMLTTYYLRATIHARPAGGENAQQPATSSEWRSEALRCL